MPTFFSDALEAHNVVKVITTNGYQMKGHLVEVDTDFKTITLDLYGEKHLVFMNAISTICEVKK